jgi:hypothetical protein
MSGDLSPHHLSLNSSYVLDYNHEGWRYLLQLPFPLFWIAGRTKQPWKIGITSTILFSCLTGDAF